MHYWLIRTAWLIALVLLTVALLSPDPARVAHGILPPEAFTPASKIVHVSTYAALTFLLALSRWPRVVTGLCLVLLGLHAAGTEYGQTFVPGRYGSLRDVGFDLLGVGLGLVAAWFVLWRRQPRRATQHDDRHRGRRQKDEQADVL